MRSFTYFILSFALYVSCKSSKSEENTSPSVSDVKGLELLEHLLGIWEGPVISTTVIGDFPTWKVDFRPISSNQISARNELDSANNIHMSFFVVRYEGRDLLCMRNGGFFSGIERLTYLFLDSASQGYYRFVEPISKGQRAYVEIVMRGPDSLILSAYTNKFRSRPSPVLHMRWTARRLDTSAAFVVARSLRFPSKVPVRDFTTFLRGREEAIFYSPIANDPYPHTEQPYLSTLHARYRHGTSYIPSSDRNVILFTTLMPLVEGLQYKPENLRYITRYVRIPASKDGFIFWHIHPGRYYLYALYDADGNGMPSSGDWFSLYGQEVNIPPETSIQAEVQINFQIP